MSELDLSASRILLVIGGGVAAFKSLEFIRRLRERGAKVQRVLTPAAERFVTPLSVAALSGAPVRQDLFSLLDEAEMGHIELSRSADLIVVAPATADFLAKMANGLADDLASTTLLATDKRVLVAPAMNVRMWTHPATQRNVARLAADGVAFVGPEDGEMACGEYGPGRMAEPMTIVAAIAADCRRPYSPAAGVGRHCARPLAGRHVLVTAGPTHEPIDPVRFIGNRSSGLQGFAIARAAAEAGARVTLVSGPVALPNPDGRPDRKSRDGVADARRRRVGAAGRRLRRRRGGRGLAGRRRRRAKVEENQARRAGAEIGRKSGHSRDDCEIRRGKPALVIGFAAETQNVVENAREKLERKGCDLIVANAVGEGTGVFGGSNNEVHIVTRDSVSDLAEPEQGRGRAASRHR